MTIFPILNAIIFILISGMHLYWVFGGTWGLEHVFPKIEGTVDKKVAAHPGPIPTLIVALGLLGFAITHGMALGWIDWGLNAYLSVIIGSIAGIFLLRAIGEFKYLGLFKKVKNSSFAYYDSLIFVPICLVLFINAVLTFVYFT